MTTNEAVRFAARQAVRKSRQAIAVATGPAGAVANTVWERRRLVIALVAFNAMFIAGAVAIFVSLIGGDLPANCESTASSVDLGDLDPLPDGPPDGPPDVPEGPYPVTSDLPVAPYVAPPGPAYGPNLIAPTLLTVEDAKQWWAQVRGGTQPPKLSVSIYELIDIIWQEATIEGISPDILFAQEILETGGYTNDGTLYNNYAGIAHYDNRRAKDAAGFDTARLGVRAHVQLLKKVVIGNTLSFFNPPASPRIRWLGRYRTNHWMTLGDAGWATGPNYGYSVLTVYSQIVTFVTGGYTPVDIPDYEPGEPMESCPSDQPVRVNGDFNWALPLPRSHLNGDLLQRPHHDYSAIDIAAPTGMQITAITEGRVDRVTNTSINFYNNCHSGPCEKCGIGATIERSDGLRVTYCHMSQRDVNLGDIVAAGQTLGQVGNTGNSTGPHLHLGMTFNSVKMCPQPWLTAIFNNTPMPTSYQTSGCSY